MDDKDYRHVKVQKDYICGYNNNGKHESLLIVTEPDNKMLARVYEKIPKSGQWQCMDCKKLHKKKVVAKIKNGGEMYVPLHHSCKPRDMDSVRNDQAQYRILALFGDGQHVENSDYFDTRKYVRFDEDEYCFGLNSVRRPDSCLIVKDKKREDFVYEYYPHNNRKWYCRKCYTTYEKKDYGAFVNGYLYLPKYHSCHPILAEQSKENQQALESDDFEAAVLFLKNRQKLNIVDQNDYQFGVTQKHKNLKDQKLIIVCDNTHRNLVKEYHYKASSIWHCIDCSLKKKYDVYAIMKEGNLYVSTEHKCPPKSYHDVMEKQIRLLNVGKSRQEIDILLKNCAYKMPLTSNLKALSCASKNIPSLALPGPSTDHRPRRDSNERVSNERTTRSRSIAILPAVTVSDNQRATRSRTAAMHQQQQASSFVTVTNSSAPPRLPRSRTSVASSSSSVARKRGRPPKNSSASLNSNSRIYDDLQSLRTNSPDIPNSLVTNNQEDIALSSSTPNQKYRQSLPSSYLSEIFNNEEPSSKKFKNEVKESIIFNLDYPKSASSIPKLIPNEPQSLEDQTYANENDQLNSEIWPTYDDFDSPYNDGQNKNDLVENNYLRPPSIQNSKGLTEFDQPLAKSGNTVNLRLPASEIEEPTDGCYGFKHLTTYSVKAILEKLELPFNEENFQFLKVEIDQIKPTSFPGKTSIISPGDDSFFKCLSCFFCGEEKHFQSVKSSCREYFFDNYKKLDPYKGIIFSTMVPFTLDFMSLHAFSYLVSVHYNLICEYLGIRIGIFYGFTKRFKKYGNWNDEESPILLIKKEQDFYTPVLTLV